MALICTWSQVKECNSFHSHHLENLLILLSMRADIDIRDQHVQQCQKGLLWIKSYSNFTSGTKQYICYPLLPTLMFSHSHMPKYSEWWHIRMTDDAGLWYSWSKFHAFHVHLWPKTWTWCKVLTCVILLSTHTPSCHAYIIYDLKQCKFFWRQNTAVIISD